MSTLTGKDLNLVKPELTDDYKVTIGTDLPANFQKIDDEFSAHLAESAIHKTSNVIRTETNTKLKVEVVSSSGSESPEQGRIVFDASLGEFLGGNGSEWV